MILKKKYINPLSNNNNNNKMIIKYQVVLYKTSIYQINYKIKDILIK